MAALPSYEDVIQKTVCYLVLNTVSSCKIQTITKLNLSTNLLKCRDIVDELSFVMPSLWRCDENYSTLSLNPTLVPHPLPQPSSH